jgi:hypothetical protein
MDEDPNQNPMLRRGLIAVRIFSYCLRFQHLRKTKQMSVFKLLRVLVALAVAVGSCGLANASLIGDMVGTRYVSSTGLDTGIEMNLVGPGIDGNFFQNQFFDYDANSFQISSTGNFGGIWTTDPLDTISLQLSSLDFTTGPLTGVSFLTNLSGVSMSFTGNSVTFSWKEQNIGTGVYLSAQFTTSGTTIPEPGSLLVWGLMGLVGAGMNNRRRKI